MTKACVGGTVRLMLGLIVFLYGAVHTVHAASFIPPDSDGVDGPGVPGQITDSVVKNFEYHLIFGDRIVPLKDGEYNLGDNPDNFISAELTAYRIIDINSDGPKEAVVVIAHHEMGSGIFYELTALAVQKNRIIQTNSVLLGDRIKINGLTVSGQGIMPYELDREILLDLTVHGKDDASCCPSKNKILCFYIKNYEVRDCAEKPVIK